jgi:type I restriction enzyme S subunit
MGKLVPQDPNDEPASELLKRIQAEKAKLIAEGKIKKSKPLAEIMAEEKPFDLPDGWEWVRLQDITKLITDGKHGDCNNLPNSGYYFLSAKDIQNGKLLYETARQIEPTEFQEVHQRTGLESGDICMVNTGATVGKIAIAPDHPFTNRTTFQKSVAIIKIMQSHIEQKYITNFLIAEAPNLLKKSGGSAINNLLLGDLKMKLVPLPSKREQIEIVAKVNELMVISEQLKSSITSSNQLQQKLADVIIEQVLY